MDKQPENEKNSDSKSNVVAALIIIGFLVGLVYINVYASIGVAVIIGLVFGVLALFLFHKKS